VAARKTRGSSIEAEANPQTREEAIGGRLKAMFDAVASGPMPSRLTVLVDELERKHAGRRVSGPN